MDKKTFYKKAGFLTAIFIAAISIIGVYGYTVYTQPKEVVWHLKETIKLDALGEYNPGAEGWLETFCLDYSQTPSTYLATNKTYSGDAQVRGYVDADNTEVDLKSEDPFYFCVRCKFDDQGKDEGSWIWDRYKVVLTVTGDETISAVEEYDNSSSSGDAVFQGVDTSNTHCYITFWWDDGVDGYRITDDGSLTWAISIYEKY